MKLSKLKSTVAKPQTSAKRSAKDETAVRIDAYLQQQYNKALDYIPKPSHVPSSFGSKCMRKIYYTYWKVDKDTPVDAKSAKIFETGRYYEDMVMSWLKGIGEHIPYRNRSNGEIPLDRDGSGKRNPQFPISVPEWKINKGFIDNVGFSGGELWLYEIKSSNSFKFQQLQEPMEEHLVQTTPYLKAFNKALNNGEYSHISELSGQTLAVGVKFVYINKDTTDLKIFSLYQSSFVTITDVVEEKIKKADTYILPKILPPKTEDKCNWCPFKVKCKNNWNISVD